MVKIDREVDYGYGNFVDYKILKISDNAMLHKDYVPYKKEVVYYEFEKDKQKIKDDYQKEMDAYDKAIELRKRKYKEEYEKYYGELKGKVIAFFCVIYVILFLIIGAIDSGAGLAFFFISIIILAPSIWIANVAADISGATWGNLTFEMRKEKLWFNSMVEPRFEEDVLGPPPQKPEKPDNYPKGRPRVRKTKKYKLTKEDKFYDEYLGRKRQYQTESTCPICNALIRFDEVRKPPFEDKCEICEYSFTFIYKEITEWYKNAYDKRCYIPYDGIKPTRPRAPSKGDYVSDGKRKPIPQDVKDKVWNRDNGKCIQCGSNENLEFDHIIPLSKGGANTYRNIQLLCEHCNRSKSDNIG